MSDLATELAKQQAHALNGLGQTAPVVKMSRSATQGKLVAALIEAKKKFTTVAKTKTAKVQTKTGGEYQYQYADLADIATMCDPPLLENGLVVFQDPTIEYERDATYVTVVSELRHVSDEWRSIEVCLICLNTTAQGIGSAITYARRYGIGPLLGIVTEKDDDGQVADARPQHRPAQPEAANGKRTADLKAKLSAKAAREAEQSPPSEPSPHNPQTGEVVEPENGPEVPAGQHAGTPISELSDKQLAGYLKLATEGNGKSPLSRPQWRAAVEAEISRRAQK